MRKRVERIVEVEAGRGGGMYKGLAECFVYS